MKIAKRILTALLFLLISGSVFALLVSLFDVERTANLAPSGNAGSRKPGNINISGTLHPSLNPENNYSLNQNSVVALTDKQSAELLQDIDIDQLMQKVLPSVVSIEAQVQTSSIFGSTHTGTSAGSGILLFHEDNLFYILTNNHVVSGATKISVTFCDGTTATCQLKGRDSVADLAILTLNDAELSPQTLASIETITPADESNIEVGDMVLAIGNPLGYGTSVTVGYISATNREVVVDGNTMRLIQTDAAINPGNSGGALINLKGELIGINSAKQVSDRIEGMGYAIPVSTALPIVSELMNYEELAEEERGYLGIYIETITSEMAESFGWPIGIYITEIVEGGAAAASDLLPADIITEVNGISVTTTNQLAERVNSHRHGTTITLTVERLINGAYVTLSIPVTLTPKPEGLE